MSSPRITETMLDSERDTTQLVIRTILGAILTATCAFVAQQLGDHAMHAAVGWIRTVVRFPELSESAIWVILLGSALSLTYCVHGMIK